MANSKARTSAARVVLRNRLPHPFAHLLFSGTHRTAADGNQHGLYFVSDREGTIGSLDMWRIGFDPKTSRYSNAEHLDAISSAGFEGHIDPEAGYIWTIREGGFGGSDIWQARRDEDGAFIDPNVLGAPVNTEYEEPMPSPLDHGRAFYFPSDRPGGAGNLDIYIAKRTGE